jgi:hypothetical protein
VSVTVNTISTITARITTEERTSQTTSTATTRPPGNNHFHYSNP